MSALKFAADVKRLDLIDLRDAIGALEAQGVDELHFDIADGRFIPRFGLAPELIAAVKDITGLPCHAHLLIQQPDRLLPEILRCGADTVTIHLETCVHIHRALSLIRDAGKQAGVAVLQATTLTKVSYVLPLIDRLLLLGADPVAPPARMPRAAFERLRILGENIRYHEYSIALEIEGPLAVEDAARCTRFNAARVVVGEQDVPGLGDAGHPDAVETYRKQLAAALHMV